MMAKKKRDDVRPEVTKASKAFGGALLILGLAIAVVAGVVLPLLDRESTKLFYFAFACFATGVPFAFPRSAMGHAIIGRFDALLDKVLPAKAP